MSDLIKVPGYVIKEVYNGNIEYRNFSDSLVGNQSTSTSDTPLFTMGNFTITTNLDKKNNKNYKTNNFSNYISLETLNNNSLISSDSLLLTPKLNLNYSDLKQIARFGSLSEKIRVTLENVIIKYPASLYVQPFSVNDIGQTLSLPTFLNYTYDNITNLSEFYINTNLIKNSFEINYLNNGYINETTINNNKLRDFTTYFTSYVIEFNGNLFEIKNMVGSNTILDDTIKLTVVGDIFGGSLNNVSYHIRPNDLLVDNFYVNLNILESNLINRNTTPKNKAKFTKENVTDYGINLFSEVTFVWPLSDGYNIDFNTSEYIDYVTNLISMCEEYDTKYGNLVNRFFVSESINSFDTTGFNLSDIELDNNEQRVNKLLQIYGVNFDELNKQIYGISLANTITYNKIDNLPDIYVKNLANILGWDVLNLFDIDNVDNLITSRTSDNINYFDAQTELWRRLVLNTPWLWKSKGTRKSVDFLLKFMGIPDGLVNFNEHIYLVENKIDISEFNTILNKLDLVLDLDIYSVDIDGYPNPTTGDTKYFQSAGKWYRETSGDNSNLDTNIGNNPHIGGYDNGKQYLEQFKTLIPEFKPVLLSGTTIDTRIERTFVNYNYGLINNYSGDTFVDLLPNNDVLINNKYDINTYIIDDPHQNNLLTDCGCDTNIIDRNIIIDIKEKDEVITICDNLATTPNINDGGLFVFEKYQYNVDGSIFELSGSPVLYNTVIVDRECCKIFNGEPMYYDFFDDYTNQIMSGYACCSNNNCSNILTCNWYLKQQPIYINGEPYCDFTTFFGNGINKVVSTDDNFCPKEWTIPVNNITDPYTNEIGVGCKIKPEGLLSYNTLVTLFKNRADSGNCVKIIEPIPPQPKPLTEYCYKPLLECSDPACQGGEPCGFIEYFDEYGESIIIKDMCKGNTTTISVMSSKPPIAYDMELIQCGVYTVYVYESCDVISGSVKTQVIQKVELSGLTTTNDVFKDENGICWGYLGVNNSNYNPSNVNKIFSDVNYFNNIGNTYTTCDDCKALPIACDVEITLNNRVNKTLTSSDLTYSGSPTNVKFSGDVSTLYTDSGMTIPYVIDTELPISFTLYHKANNTDAESIVNVKYAVKTNGLWSDYNDNCVLKPPTGIVSTDSLGLNTESVSNTENNITLYGTHLQVYNGATIVSAIWQHQNITTGGSWIDSDVVIENVSKNFITNSDGYNFRIKIIDSNGLVGYSNVLTKHYLLPTETYCFRAKWDCDDVVHNCPDMCGVITYIDEYGHEITEQGFCTNDGIIQIIASSIVSTIGVDEVDCP